MLNSMNDWTIAVIGVGQIGGSFALALKENRIGKKIIGIDREDNVEGLRVSGILDEVTSNLKEGIKDADLIFLSTPVLTILEMLPGIISLMKQSAVLLDSGSTKKQITDIMKRYPDKYLIGGHPMAGREASGFAAADPDLFKDKIFSLSFPTKKSEMAKNLIWLILESIGAIPHVIDSEHHDVLVALTSHLPYILSLSLSTLAEELFEEDKMFQRFVASGFLGATRLSGTQEDMGAGMLKTNSINITQMIEMFQAKIERMKELLNKSPSGELTENLRKLRTFQKSVSSEKEH